MHRHQAVCCAVGASMLALAGVGSGANRAYAQAVETCQLPPGVAPLPDPDVTAQQVEQGGDLGAFARSARDIVKSYTRSLATLEEFSYFGCRLRQEGSGWYSGSTYLVQLEPGGKLVIHAKDQSLADRQLNPLIYRTILSSLGVPPDVIASLATSDPDAAGPALAAVLAHEPDAPFVADVPGASGHAAVYISAGSGNPLVLLAGFDLDQSHLETEQIDHAEPEVSARDVVDRETLKAFVTEAGNWLTDHLQNAGTTSAALEAKAALTDPNGPWKHGSVYLGVTDRTANIILIHGGFPERFEFKPPGIARDPDTGKLIYDMMLEAVDSGPEGGFFEYRFDDPADDTDDLVPKIGYAREFSGTISGGGPFTYIIQSGFYPSSPPMDVAGRDTVVEAVLPEVLRAMTAGTVEAVSSRVRRAASGVQEKKRVAIGGASTIGDLLMANRGALENGSFKLDRLLADSSFALPLAARHGERQEERGGAFSDLTFWGSGDYRNLSGGGDGGSVAYDGTVVSGHVGIDAMLGESLLAGLSVAHGRGTVDYTDPNAQEGELATALTSLNPYIGWQAASGFGVWAAAGYGRGEVSIKDANAGSDASDLTQWMFAAGASGPLVSSDEVIPGGTTALSLKAETALMQAEIDGSETLRSRSLNVGRHRLALEGSHWRMVSSGATLVPSIEIGMRYDGGDGETGNGLEAAGGLRYSDPSSGLTVEGRIRGLLSHSSDYEEWGASGLVQIAPGQEGRGLSASLRPSWGLTAMHRLWEGGVPDVAGVPSPAGRMDAEIGYGFGVPGGIGVVTPYAGLGLAAEGRRSWRAGARWHASPFASVSLEGVRRGAAGDGAFEHSLTLRGAILW